MRVTNSPVESIEKNMCPRTILRLARLSLFYRVVYKSPPLLGDIIDSQSGCKYKKGWVASLRSDLEWLCQSEFFQGCRGFDVRQWFELVRSKPKAFLSNVRKFCKSPFANIVTQWADTSD